MRQAAELVDKGTSLHTTLTECIDGMSAANLRRAHAMVETGATVGKVVLEYVM